MPRVLFVDPEGRVGRGGSLPGLAGPGGGAGAGAGAGAGTGLPEVGGGAKAGAEEGVIGGGLEGLVEISRVGRRAGVGGWMLLEWIEGGTVRAALAKAEKLQRSSRCAGAGAGADGQEAGIRDLLARIGSAVGRLHGLGIVHGDLTTSNLMVRTAAAAAARNGLMNGEAQALSDGTSAPVQPAVPGEVVIIDFGLGSVSSQDEDRAVDLYVLERAFASTHPELEGWFDEVVLGAYARSFEGAEGALRRLEEVRMRGRKRNMVG